MVWVYLPTLGKQKLKNAPPFAFHDWGILAWNLYKSYLQPNILLLLQGFQPLRQKAIWNIDIGIRVPFPVATHLQERERERERERCYMIRSASMIPWKKRIWLTLVGTSLEDRVPVPSQEKATNLVEVSVVPTYQGHRRILEYRLSG